MKNKKNHLSEKTYSVNNMLKKKKIEERLKESENKYRRLFETAQDSILILNADTGVIEDSNPFIEKLLGYSKKELVGKQIWEVSPFKNIAANKSKFIELQKKKYVSYEDLPLETKSGKKVHVEFVSNVYKVEGKKVIQCNIRDITDRKRVEDRLKEKEEEIMKLRESKVTGRESKATGRETAVLKREEESREYAAGIVDTIREPLIVLNTNLRVISANKSFYDTFKVNKNETENHLIYQLGNGQWDIPELRKLLEEILPKKKVFNNFEVEHVFKNIGKKTMLLNARQLDHVLLILLAMEDITEQKKANKDLKKSGEKIKQQVEQLKVLDVAKSDFLNMVSHELKTPLTAIYANLELLEEAKAKLSEKNINNLDALRRNSNQLRFLIDNILEIARIQSNKFVLNISEVDLEDCINSIENNLKVLADKKNIKLIIEIDKPINISTDEIRLKEILTNLIDNAIKFTEKGYVKVKAKKKDNNILVEVIDTGMGIAKDKQFKLFEKFYQVHNPLENEVQGTGLGLSITKQLVELLGGKINFKSVRGKGSTFYFKLPIKYKKEAKR